MEFINFINIGAIASTIFATIVGVKLWKKQGIVEEQTTQILTLQSELKKANERVATLGKFCETVSTSISNNHNVIIIGPRASGKSSLVSLWCEVDKLIATVSPTISFDTYQYDLNKSINKDYFDKRININRIQTVDQLIKFYDYAGEDEQIPNAIENITNSPNCTIVMVFNSDPGYANDNRRYFSRSLIERINTAFNHKNFQTSSVKNIYIVFNKIDLFGTSYNNLNDSLPNLKKEFTDNTTNIESIFGINVKYMVSSALTNHNVVNLLQNIVQSYGK